MTKQIKLSITIDGLERIVSPLQLKPYDLLTIIQPNDQTWPEMLYADHRYITEHWAIALYKHEKVEGFMIYTGEYRTSSDNNEMIAIQVLYKKK